MSRGNGRGPSGGDGDDEDVGYGKPPKRTRFKPGQSGNPKGRPKRAFGKHHLANVILQRAREIFIEEGDRKMPIREGDTVINLTAYRAAVRSAHISAAKGSAMAQRTVIQERHRIEAEISDMMGRAFRETIMYKEDCARERVRCRKAGLSEPSFPIDPDYLVLDYESLTVEYEGPMAEQLKGNEKERLRCRDEWAEDFQLWREDLDTSTCSPGRLALTLQSQRNYDIMNESLRPRYRKTLHRRLSEEEIGDLLNRLRRSEPRKVDGAGGP